MGQTPDVRVTILVDNHGRAGLATEHGLSIRIEAGDHRILFDTGQGQALAPNARALTVDLGDTDVLVLSHGHYDHTGGIAAVVAAPGVHVYGHPAMVWPRYAIRDGVCRAIQMPHESMAAVAALDSARLHWVSRPAALSASVGITGPIARQTAFEDSGGPFFLDPEGRRPDAIDDDLALWVKTDRGLVVVTGCCHAGLINTLRQIGRLNPGEPIRAIIGGFHLLNASPRRLEETVKALRILDLERLVACHCTGEGAVKFLFEALGSRVSAGAAGDIYRF